MGNSNKRETKLSNNVVMTYNGYGSDIGGDAVYCIRAYHPNAKTYSTAETAYAIRIGPNGVEYNAQCSNTVEAFWWWDNKTNYSPGTYPR